MLLRVEDLRSEFVPKHSPATVAVRNVSLTLDRGEILGVVGESGSGKSVTALSLVGLVDPPGKVTAGTVVFDGHEIAHLPERRLRELRGRRIAFIFQDPMTALNPVLTIGTQICETIRAHETIGRSGAKEAGVEWLRRVRIADPAHVMSQYPHELSGGMRQRAMIAMAFCLRPEMLIADEPTTALDVTVQKQILDLMDEMRRDTGTAVMLITHDLGIVAERCDRAAVMYGGEIVETATVEDLFSAPKHPYTRALLAAIPDMTRWNNPDEAFAFLPGRPPRLSADAMPPGCAFAPRCRSVMPLCRDVDPPVVNSRSGAVRCHLYGEQDAVEQ